MTDEPAVDDSTVSEPDGEPSESRSDANHGPGCDRGTGRFRSVTRAQPMVNAMRTHSSTSSCGP